jgi:uncharacterized membrane protein YkoI
MKNLLFIAMLTGIFLTACGQKKDVPQAVKTAFNQKFSNATKVKWENEDENEWEAEFKMSGKEYSANFDSKGKWLETEYEIKKSEIPEAVQKTIKSEFREYEMEEAEVAENADGIFYEVKFEMDEKDMEVVFKADGTVVKKESENEENEEKEEGEEHDGDDD